MKSHRKELWFDVPQRWQLLNITPQVEEALRESGIREGLCLVNAMHISASVFVNDDERASMPTLRNGWSGWPRRSRTPSTRTTGARTTPTRT